MIDQGDNPTKRCSIYSEISSGAFAREWQNPLSRLKHRVLRFFATRQKLHKIEKRVRERLGFPAVPELHPPEKPEVMEKLMKDPQIREELSGFFDGMEYWRPSICELTLV